jgi:hypothetical protein
MGRADNPFSAADRAALDILAVCQIQTHKALQQLARTIAAERGIPLDSPRQEKPSSTTRGPFDDVFGSLANM